MKANAPKRKVFNDAVDLLTGGEPAAAGKGVQMLPVDSIKPFHSHPFHLYEGEQLDDMVESVRECSHILLLYWCHVIVIKPCGCLAVYPCEATFADGDE